MTAAAFVLQRAWSDRAQTFPRVRVKPDAEGAVLTCVKGGVLLTPADMRRLAVELLDLAQQSDGKDWIEELERL